MPRLPRLRRGALAWAAAALAAGTAPLPAQPACPAQPPRLAASAGLAVASPLLQDGNGTTVRLAPAPWAGARLAPARLRLGHVALAVEARLAGGAVRLRSPDARWRAGTAWQGDLLARADLALRPGLWLHAGVGATRLAAPRDVAPFDRLRGARPAAEAGIEWRPRGSPLALRLGAQAFRVQPAGGRSGGVARALVGVTRAP